MIIINRTWVRLYGPVWIRAATFTYTGPGMLDMGRGFTLGVGIRHRKWTIEFRSGS